MRRFAFGILLGTVVLAGCARDENQPAGPSAVQRPLLSIAVCDPDPLVTAAQIENLINQLFTGGNRTAALQRFRQIKTLLTAPPPHNVAGAKKQTYGLVDYALNKFNQGSLVNVPGAVTDLVNLLFCFAGIPESIGPLGPDGAAALYQPGSPALLLLAPSGFGGISLPPGTGTVTQPTIISLNRHLPDFPGPLLTALDQFPLYYDFNTSSGETFLQDAVVGVCLAENVLPADPSRLGLAHNVPEPNPTTIEILPPAPGFLDCTGAQAALPPIGSAGGGLGTFAVRAVDAFFRRIGEVIGPDALYAATLATTGTTGTTKNLSPFGAVDTLAILDAASAPTGQTAPAGSPVAPPQVLVKTPLGTPVPGVTVTFTVTLGGGTLTAVGSSTQVSSVVTVTDAAGKATVGSWTLGTVGINRVNVQATPLYPGSGITPVGGRNFTATAN